MHNNIYYKQYINNTYHNMPPMLPLLTSVVVLLTQCQCCASTCINGKCCFRESRFCQNVTISDKTFPIITCGNSTELRLKGQSYTTSLWLYVAICRCIEIPKFKNRSSRICMAIHAHRLYNKD